MSISLNTNRFGGIEGDSGERAVSISPNVQAEEIPKVRGISDEMAQFMRLVNAVDASKPQPLRPEISVNVRSISRNKPEPSTINLSDFASDTISSILEAKDRFVENRIYRPLNRAMRPKVIKGPVTLLLEKIVGQSNTYYKPVTPLERKVNSTSTTVTSNEKNESQNPNNIIEKTLLIALAGKDSLVSFSADFAGGLIGLVQEATTAVVSFGVEKLTQFAHALSTPILNTLKWAFSRAKEFHEWDTDMTSRIAVFLAVSPSSPLNFSEENNNYMRRINKGLVSGVFASLVYKLGVDLQELNFDNFANAGIFSFAFGLGYAGFKRTLEWMHLPNEIVKAEISRIFSYVGIALVAGSLMGPIVEKQPQQIQGVAMPLYRGQLTNIESYENESILQRKLYLDVHEHPEKIIVYLARGYATIDGVRIPVDLSLLNFASGQQIPLQFIDQETGEPLFEGHKRIWYANSELDSEFIEVLKNVESAPYAPYTAVGEWIANVAPRVLRGTMSGGTTPDMGIPKILEGKIGEVSLIGAGEGNKTYFYRPDLYSPEYIAKLALAISQGRVPQDLLDLMEGDELPQPQDISRADTDSKSNAVAQQLERLALGLRYVQLYGEEAVIEAWANSLPFGGAVDSGLAVQGVSAQAKYLFGKEPHDLTLLEKIIIARMIHQPGTYINDLVEKLNQHENPVNNFTSNTFDNLTGANSTILMDSIFGWTDADGQHEGLLDVMERKGQITPEQRAEIEVQRSQIKWVLRTPDAFRNEFLGRGGIQDENRTTAEVVMSAPGERYDLTSESAKPNVVSVTPDKIVVQIDIAEEGLAKDNLLRITPGLSPEVSTVSMFETKIENEIKSRLEKHTNPDGSSYFTFKPFGDSDIIKEYSIGVAREFHVMEFDGRPGIAVGVSASKPGQTEIATSIYDGTEGILSDLPVEPGSSIKLLMWAIGLAHDNREGADYFLTDQVSDKPARVRLAINATEPVRNATPSTGRLMTAADSLVQSRNVTILRVIQNILYRDLPLDPGFKQDPKRLNYLGEENLAAKAEVKRRWNEIIQGDLAKLGVVLVDLEGNYLDMPGDLSAIGTETRLTDIRNLQNGKFVPKHSSLGAYSRTFLAFGDPNVFPELAKDPDLAEAVRVVGQAMTNKKFRPKGTLIWMNTTQDTPIGPIQIGGKGGTVQIGDGRTMAILGTYFTVGPDGEVRSVVVYSRGRRDGQELNLDTEAKINLTPASSTGILPFARNIAVEASIMGIDDLIETRRIKENYTQLVADDQVKVVKLDNQYKIYNSGEDTFVAMPKGSTVDFIGEPTTYYTPEYTVLRQEVAYLDEEGNFVRGHIFTNEKQPIAAQDSADAKSDLRAILLSSPETSLLADELDKITIIPENTSSPALKAIYSSMASSQSLGTGPEVLSDISTKLGLPSDQIFIHEGNLRILTDDFVNQYEQFLLGRSTSIDGSYSKDVLVRTIQNLLRQQKLQIELKTVGQDLQSLMWENNKLTPAGSLIFALSDEGINSTTSYDAGILQTVTLPYTPSSPILRRIDRIRLAKDAYEEIVIRGNASPERIEKFNRLLQAINKAPTPSELSILGLSGNNVAQGTNSNSSSSP